MKLYIDDLRDPVRYLTPEQAEGIVWIKDWCAAKKAIHDNAEILTEIHFDHFMPPGNRTGSELFGKVLYNMKRNKFPNLKKVYVHTSDTEQLANLMLTKDAWAEYGVELINNSTGF